MSRLPLPARSLLFHPSRRNLLTAAAASAAAWQLPVLAQAELAQITVGFPPGGPADIVARLLVDAGLGDAYGRRMMVDNKPGAASMLAIRAVAKSPANGCNLLLTPTFLLTNAAVYDKPGYDPIKDFTPVAPLGTTYLVLVVNAKAPWRSLREFVTYARAKGEAAAFGSAGIGTGTHLMGFALNQSAGLKLNHIPYRGEAAATQALLTQEIDIGFIAYASARSHLEAGGLRALAVATSGRQPELPQTPTLLEEGAPHPLWDTEGGWFGVFAPAGTPAPLVQKLAEAIRATLSKPVVVESLSRFGIRPWHGTPEAWARKLPSEFEQWKKIVADANVRLTL